MMMLKVFDNTGNTYTINLSMERMMVDGKYFSHNDKCYLPILRHF